VIAVVLVFFVLNPSRRAVVRTPVEINTPRNAGHPSHRTQPRRGGNHEPSCLGNLKQIGITTLMMADDTGTFPTGAAVFAELQRIDPQLLVCDKAPSLANGYGYSVNIEGVDIRAIGMGGKHNRNSNAGRSHAAQVVIAADAKPAAQNRLVDQMDVDMRHLDGYANFVYADSHVARGKARGVKCVGGDALRQVSR